MTYSTDSATSNLLTNAVTDENELSFASAHGLVAGTAVVYNDNSVATITGLTDGVTYYVLDGTTTSKMKLEASLAGGAITIAAGGGAANNKITYVRVVPELTEGGIYYVL